MLFSHLENKRINHNIDIVSLKDPFGENVNCYFKNLMSVAHQESYEDKYRNESLFIKSPNLLEYENTVAACEFTLNKIQENTPDLYQEMSEIIDKIIVVESNGVNAGSYLNALGTFIVRTFDSESEHWTRMLEHIVHESAHNLLYHLWYQAPLITDDDGLYYTPFRLDRRPLSGVYHAMYVLSRTIFAFNQLLQNDVIRVTDIKSHYNEANNHTSFQNKFFQTVEVIESSRKMTAFGNKLLDDCVQLVNDCKSTF
ncbi:HEXXH motif-containing putative peptide modification protein [Photobacterium sp. 1_MG-2023]|uniref:aKG-HExxH-type peptide beta-hydroxylase n=1 Tax=Photobacterium sp. 1_MG-2023 TaxID=3062646 RepID=UPI0026E1EB71|nr:HEXXH motif-containing putative peptide modification protein [Photobacterium sp. 1_MG-2023]MDO6704947.1 HEXXH motif-containing putative peptide modification protein [Photobacterium sp. 1_MG-2023]